MRGRPPVPGSNQPAAPADRWVTGRITTGSTFTIRMAGEWDIAGQEPLSDMITRFVDSRCEHVVIDVTEVTFMDSWALGALYSLRMLADGMGGTATLIGVQRSVDILLRVTGLHGAFRHGGIGPGD